MLGLTGAYWVVISLGGVKAAGDEVGNGYSFKEESSGTAFHLLRCQYDGVQHWHSLTLFFSYFHSLVIIVSFFEDRDSKI